MGWVRECVRRWLDVPGPSVLSSAVGAPAGIRFEPPPPPSFEEKPLAAYERIQGELAIWEDLLRHPGWDLFEREARKLYGQYVNLSLAKDVTTLTAHDLAALHGASKGMDALLLIAEHKRQQLQHLAATLKDQLEEDDDRG